MLSKEKLFHGHGVFLENEVKNEFNFTLLLKSIRLKFPDFLKYLLFIGIFTYLSLLISSVLIANQHGTTRYSIITHTISNLGSKFHTPFPSIFDLACILAGFITIPINVLIKKELKHRIIKNIPKSRKIGFIYKLLRIGTIFGMIGGLGYVFVGIFSLERPGPLSLFHYFFTGLAFGGFIFSMLFISLSMLFFQNPIPKLFGINGLLSPIIICFLYLILATPFLEWVLLFVILAFKVPFYSWILLH